MTAFLMTQRNNSMVDLLSLEVEDVDTGVGAPVAGAARILHTKFCEGRENWSGALVVMHLLRYDACDGGGGGGGGHCCYY
jgi:hypothetical protein